MRLSHLALAALLVAAPGVAQAATVLDYNVLVSGNFTSNGSDTEGRIAAGGSITVGSYSIAQKNSAASGSYAAVAGGSFTGQSGTAYGSVLASSYSGAFTVNGSKTTYAGGGSSPIAIASEMSRLTALSTDLAANPQSYGTIGTVQNAYNQLFLVGSGSALNIFNISGSDLASNSGIHLAIPVGALAVFNISGTTDGVANAGSDSSTYNGQNVGFTPASYNAANVLYNFYQATSLTPSGSVNASILAPTADISANGGVITGQVIGKSYSGQTQINWVPLNSTKSGVNVLGLSAPTTVGAVPEPASWMTMVLGFGALGGALRRKRGGAPQPA